MGIWTWLDRYDAAPYDAWCARVGGDPYGKRPGLDECGHVGIHTHRAWHALHVALTGAEEGGAPPASYVVWTSSGASETSFTSAFFMHSSGLVREVAAHLRYSVDYERAVADLYAAIELGVYVYSFEGYSGEQDMVQCGFFRRVFEDVRRFYIAAADAEQVIVIRRG